jgi:hypothetical protein
MAEYEKSFLRGLIHSVSKVEGGLLISSKRLLGIALLLVIITGNFVSFTKLFAELSGVNYGIPKSSGFMENIGTFLEK